MEVSTSRKHLPAKKHLDLSLNLCDRIDILIIDIDMGEMNSIELYTHIREERPEMAVLFISADVDRIQESLPNCSVLEKSFHARQFVAKVAEGLSASRDLGTFLDSHLVTQKTREHQHIRREK
jgi:DNA-binding NarL/FixJ family response regulator